MAKLPNWQTQAIRKLVWQAFFLWFVTLLVGVILIRIFPSGTDQRSGWGLVVGLPATLVIILIVPTAYVRGVRDSREYPMDSDVDQSI